MTDGDRRVALTAVLRVVHSRLGSRGGAFMAPCASATGQAVVVPPPVAQDCRSGCGTSRARCGPAGPRERLLGHCRGRSRRGRGVSRRVSRRRPRGRGDRPLLRERPAGAHRVHPGGCGVPRRRRGLAPRPRRDGARRGSRTAERTRADARPGCRPRAGHHRRGRGRGRGETRRARRIARAGCAGRRRRDGRRRRAARPDPRRAWHVAFTSGGPGNRAGASARTSLAHYCHGKNTRMGVTRDSTFPASAHVRPCLGRFATLAAGAARFARVRSSRAVVSPSHEPHAHHADAAGRHPRGRGAARRARPRGARARRRRRVWRSLAPPTLPWRAWPAYGLTDAACTNAFAGGTRARQDRIENRSERAVARGGARRGRGRGRGRGRRGRRGRPRGRRGRRRLPPALAPPDELRFDDAAKTNVSSSCGSRGRRWASGTRATLRRRGGGSSSTRGRASASSGPATWCGSRRAGNRRENKKMNAASPCVSRGGARANANSS